MKNTIITILAVACAILACNYKSNSDKIADLKSDRDSAIYLKGLAQTTANYWYEVSKQLAKQIKDQSKTIQTES